MSEANINTTAWTEVVTTSADTVFQNQSNNPMYITTETTGSLDFDQGLKLVPNAAVVIASGNTVSAVAHRTDSTLFYMSI